MKTIGLRSRSTKHVKQFFASALLIYSVLLAPMATFARANAGTTAPVQNSTTVGTSPIFASNYLSDIASTITNWFSASTTTETTAPAESPTLEATTAAASWTD
jgi:hypothetical protein